MPKPFHQLEIYKKGYELLMNIYKITKKYPSEEKYNLTSQTRSSANSVIAIIAEAHGRYFFADKVRILYQSRGEVEETISHLMVAKGVGYISEAVFQGLIQEYEGLGRGISAYINYLERKKNPNLPINKLTN